MPGMTSLHSRMIETEGARLFVQRAGDGPPVVLIHAGIADSRMWRAQLEGLAGHFSVIAYDVRSFGRSTGSDAEYADHDDLAALLRALSIERATVIGCSNGGRIALDFALAYPEMVSALVLSAPGLRGFDWSEQTRAGWADEESAIERGNIAAATDVNLRMWVDGPGRSPDQIDPELRELAREMASLCLTRHSGDGPARPLAPPSIQRLGEVKVPVLVVVGDQDQPDMLGIAGVLADGIAGAHKVIVEGAAHLLPLERPETFNRLVLEFLSGGAR
jgi:3-oxoadipate enol-lactonase